MKKVYASQAARQLGDAGFTSLSSSRTSRVSPLDRGFRAKKDSDYAAFVQFFGRIGDELEVLAGYSSALSNLGYRVETVPDEGREGRRVVRVTRS